MPGAADYEGIGEARKTRRAAEEGRKPKGARPGTRVVQGSKVDPGRFPNAGQNRKADLTVWFGPMRKRTVTVPVSDVRRKLERYAANRQKAVARDAMSGDMLGETKRILTRPGKPERWGSVCSV